MQFHETYTDMEMQKKLRRYSQWTEHVENKFNFVMENSEVVTDKQE